MVTVLLIAGAAVFLYAVSLLRWPFRPCVRCKGTGTNRGSNRRRWGMCRRCGGAKQVRRLGAAAVHRFWWAVLGDTLRARRNERVGKARGKAGYPEL